MLALASMLAQTKLTQAKVARVAITNRVLLEEASRYDDLPCGFVETPCFGRALVVSGSFGLGGLVETEEERSLDPLSIVLDDGSE